MSRKPKATAPVPVATTSSTSVPSNKEEQNSQFMQETNSYITSAKSPLVASAFKKYAEQHTKKLEAEKQKEQKYAKHVNVALELHEILPHITPNEIVKILRYTKGDREIALDLLLHDFKLSEEESMQMDIEEGVYGAAVGGGGAASSSSSSTFVEGLGEGGGMEEGDFGGLADLPEIKALLHELEDLEQQYLTNSKLIKAKTQELQAMETRAEELQRSIAKKQKQSAAADQSLEQQEAEGQATTEVDEVLVREKALMERSRENLKRRYGYFYCEGELKLLMECKKGVTRYTLHRTPFLNYDGPLFAENIHFRICESQIHRGSAFYGQTAGYYGGYTMDIEKVEYVVNPQLIQRFNDRRSALAKERGFLVESMKPFLLFHGTSEQSMDHIINNNFDQSKISSNTGNYGAYGKGFYFSVHPSYSLGYSRGGKCLLLCLVLTGKAKVLAGGALGAPLTEGYDSHVSPDGSAEVVIYSADQILPCYKLTLSSNQYYNTTAPATTTPPSYDLSKAV